MDDISSQTFPTPSNPTHSDHQAPHPPPGGRWRGELLWLAVLIAIGAALRFYRIGTGLWFDEIVTVVESVRRPLGDIVSRFPGDNHHPLYSVLAHSTVAIAGEQPWTLRLPAAVFGIASIPMLFVLGRAVTSRFEAAAAAVILTVSYHHVWFSQNARGYTAMLFFELLATYALLRWFERRQRSFAVLFAAGSALAAYAHLTAVLAVIGQAVACAIATFIEGTADSARAGAGGRRQRTSNPWRQLAEPFAAAALFTILLYAPMLRDVASVMTGGASSGGEHASLWWSVAAALRGLSAGFGSLSAIVVGGLVFTAGVVSYLTRRPLVALLFILPVVVTVGAAVLLERPLRPRFVFFAAGFAVLVTIRGAALASGAVAHALRGSSMRRVGSHAGVLLVTASVVVLSARSLSYGYSYPKQDYDEAVAVVESSLAPGDRVVVVGDGGEIPVVRYLARPWTRIDTGEDLWGLLDQGGTIWVLSTFPSYIESGQPELWRLLREECTLIHEVESTIADGAITISRCGSDSLFTGP